MFDANDLSVLDPKYFSIIFTDAFDVTIMSRNTGHYWYLHNPEYPEQGTVIIFHSHHQELYRLYFVEGYSQEEIADMKGVSQNTISKKLRRCPAAH